MTNIHFEFDLTEEEAQVLLELIADAEIDAKFHATWDGGSFNDAQKAWFASHALFLAALRLKIKFEKKT